MSNKVIHHQIFIAHESKKKYTFPLYLKNVLKGTFIVCNRLKIILGDLFERNNSTVIKLINFIEQLLPFQ